VAVFQLGGHIVIWLIDK